MLRVDLDNFSCSVGLAINEYTSKGVGKCIANVRLNNQNYDQLLFIVLKSLLTDAVLGQDFIYEHQNVNLHQSKAIIQRKIDRAKQLFLAVTF